MHYRDNLRRGQNWTPIGGQSCEPFDTAARLISAVRGFDQFDQFDQRRKTPFFGHFLS
jgi:hypothetical protein